MIEEVSVEGGARIIDCCSDGETYELVLVGCEADWTGCCCLVSVGIGLSSGNDVSSD